MYHKLEQFYLLDWLDWVNKKVLPIPICESEVTLPPWNFNNFLSDRQT
ncbi:hypothetical protein [Nostoc sp.]